MPDSLGNFKWYIIDFALTVAFDMNPLSRYENKNSRKRNHSFKLVVHYVIICNRREATRQ